MGGFYPPLRKKSAAAFGGGFFPLRGILIFSASRIDFPASQEIFTTCLTAGRLRG